MDTITVKYPTAEHAEVAKKRLNFKNDLCGLSELRGKQAPAGTVQPKKAVDTKAFSHRTRMSTSTPIKGCTISCASGAEPTHPSGG